MADVEISLEGLETLGDEILAELRPRAVAAVQDVGLFVVGAIVLEMRRGNPTGRRYPRTKDGKVHVASAPGQPPAVDLGDYAQSFDSDVDVGLFVVTASVFSGLWNTRGRRLEYGGRDSRGVYLAPRPHVRPVLARLAPMIHARLERL